MASEFSRIGKISPHQTATANNQCRDNYYSSSNWRGACSHHGGLASSRATAKNTEGVKPAGARSEFTEAATAQNTEKVRFTKKQIEEFKAIKQLFDQATRHRDNSNFNLAQHYEKKGEANVQILSKTLNLDYDIVIDLVFDFERTRKKLRDVGIGIVKTKSTWKPPYKSLAVPELGWKTETNFRFAQGKTGVYLIKRNGQLIYIGAARNVYKAMLRHFEQHRGDCYDNGHCNKQRYFDDYEKNEYLVRVVLTNTPNQAFKLEAALINRYKPRDNAYIPELFDPSVLKEFTDATPETFDKAPF
jgi:hypothetical protein